MPLDIVERRTSLLLEETTTYADVCCRYIVTYANVCCRYSGDKNIITFGGDHNSPRPAFFFVSLLLHLCGVCLRLYMPYIYDIYLICHVYIYIYMQDSVGIFFHNVLIENAELEAAEPMSPQVET